MVVKSKKNIVALTSSKLLPLGYTKEKMLFLWYTAHLFVPLLHEKHF